VARTASEKRSLFEPGNPLAGREEGATGYPFMGVPVITKEILMKNLFVFVLLSVIGMFLYSCSTTCGVPKKDAQGNPTVIQYPEK
jgi:hypothetical protein